MKISVVPVLIAAFVLSACSCGRTAIPQDSSVPPPSGWSVSEADAAAVVVSMTCMTSDGAIMGPIVLGSGVIVSSRRVLTAAHVAAYSVCAYSVTTNRGVVIPVDIEILSPQLDIARLVAPKDSFTLTPVTLGPVPDPGEEICISSAVPSREWVCGDVQLYRARLPGDVRHTGITQKGNSGSGVYDRTGRLIGIVTHLTECSGGYKQICGGKVTSLEGREWWVSSIQ